MLKISFIASFSACCLANIFSLVISPKNVFNSSTKAVFSDWAALNKSDALSVTSDFGIGIVEYQMRIYDRWGELIFESNDYDYKWDGTYKGEQVQKGVYVYQFDLLDIKGEPHLFRGHVTLFR